jgi:hypothetical protein
MAPKAQKEEEDMKRMTSPYAVSVNDGLVIEWRLNHHTKLRQGKRVPADCPIDENERRVYVKEGPVKATICIMRNRNLSLSEAYKLLNQARYGQDQRRIFRP